MKRWLFIFWCLWTI